MDDFSHMVQAQVALEDNSLNIRGGVSNNSPRSSNSRTSRSLNRSIRNYRHVEAHVSVNENHNPFNASIPNSQNDQNNNNNRN